MEMQIAQTGSWEISLLPLTLACFSLLKKKKMGQFQLQLLPAPKLYHPCSITHRPIASHCPFSNSPTFSPPRLPPYPKHSFPSTSHTPFLHSLLAAPSRLVCKMNGSDMTQQLEFGRPEKRRKPEKRVNGIFWLILLNLGMFVADHFFHVDSVKSLYLYHYRPAWYQFITATFCHASWEHLSSNLFFLYIFGKLVEEEEGNFALWLSYIFTGVGANLVSWLVLPRSAVSVGASGAVFGLFAISVLVKITWDWRKILEVLILGQFVIEKVMEAAQSSAAMSGAFRGGYPMQSVNHIAHLSGALVGVVLVWLVSRIPSPPDHEGPSQHGESGKTQ